MKEILNKLEQLKLNQLKPQYIFIPVKKEYIKLFYSEILTIQAEGNFVNVHTIKSNYIVLANLTQFTKQLPSNLFERVHKSWTVNVSKIDKYTKEHLVINNVIIPLGKSNKEKILKRLSALSIQRLP
jgi:DNA-binding LytR/AlgR family response regulator